MNRNKKLVGEEKKIILLYYVASSIAAPEACPTDHPLYGDLVIGWVIEEWVFEYRQVQEMFSF
jgi:hypothetical protein